MFPTQQYGINESQAILDEVLAEITGAILLEGSIEDHKAFQIAQSHGSDFLTGSASGLIDHAAQLVGAAREQTLRDAVEYILLTIINDRMNGAAAIIAQGGSPNDNGSAAFPPLYAQALEPQPVSPQDVPSSALRAWLNDQIRAVNLEQAIPSQPYPRATYAGNPAFN